MNVNNVSLETVAVKYSQYPTSANTEIAFVGKSNVGKSSLINTLVNRKSLARTSSSPGKTRTINFYNIENKIYFVDLPGYGYAKVSKEEQQRWADMIENYLKKREQLKSIIMLVDIRHEPSENDRLMYEWLKHYKFEIIIVATKADKIKRSQISKQLLSIKNNLNLNNDELLIPFSSLTKQGKQELWNIIDSYI